MVRIFGIHSFITKSPTIYHKVKEKKVYMCQELVVSNCDGIDTISEFNCDLKFSLATISREFLSDKSMTSF